MMGTKTAMSGESEDEVTSDWREMLPHAAPTAGKFLAQESRTQQLEVFFTSSFKSYIIVLPNNNGPVTAPAILKGNKIRLGICNYEC